MSPDQYPHNFDDTLRAALAADEDVVLTDASIVAARLRERVDVDAVSTGNKSAYRHSRTGLWYTRYIGLAAVTVIAIFGILKGRGSIRESQNSSPHSYSTVSGQRANVTLPDGSKVVLAPGTTVRVVGRDVELNGEAIFTVNQQDDSPFIVKAGGTVTRVLGTTFAVRSYSGDKVVRVSVRDGRVSVSNAVGSHILNAGRQAELGESQVVVRDTSTGSFGVAEGKLVFASTPLAGAIPDIERWYAVDIRLADSTLGSRTFQGTFRGAKVEELVEILETLFNVRVARNGRVLILKP